MKTAAQQILENRPVQVLYENMFSFWNVEDMEHTKLTITAL